MLEELRMEVYRANMELPARGLVQCLGDRPETRPDCHQAERP